MIFKRRTKRYLLLTPTEANLALRVLLHFRNKALTRGIDPVDIEELIKKLKWKSSGQLTTNCPLYCVFP